MELREEENDFWSRTYGEPRHGAVVIEHHPLFAPRIGPQYLFCKKSNFNTNQTTASAISVMNYSLAVKPICGWSGYENRVECYCNAISVNSFFSPFVHSFSVIEERNKSTANWATKWCVELKTKWDYFGDQSTTPRMVWCENVFFFLLLQIYYFVIRHIEKVGRQAYESRKKDFPTIWIHQRKID